MLVKRKKKEVIIDELEGVKFTYESPDSVYTISKESNKNLFRVSWGGKSIHDFKGYATYSKDDIVENIKKGTWKVVC